MGRRQQPAPTEKQLVEWAAIEGPERWLSVVEWEGLYDVSSYGRVRSLSTKSGGNYILKTSIDRRTSTLQVSLNAKGRKKTYPIHRLVMLAFRPEGNGEGMQVNHIDGLRQNNFLHNLEWVSREENMRHAVECGLTAWGERNCKAKLTSEQVADLKRRLAAGESSGSLQKRFGVSQVYVWKVKHGVLRRRE